MATKDRIYIDEDLVPLADRLVGRRIHGSTSAEEYFRDTKELVAFAAGLGFRKQRFRPLKKNGREVKLSAVERIHLGGADLVNALAVAKTQGVAVLHPNRAKDRAEIFEGFVNGGLTYLHGNGEEEWSVFELVAGVVRSEHAPNDAQDEIIDFLSQML